MSRHSLSAHLLCTLAAITLIGAPLPAPAQTPSAQADSLFTRGQFREAAAAYEKLAQEQPQAVPIWMRLGTSRARSADYAGAAAAFERAAGLAPRNALALFNAAAAHARLGHTDQALSWLERASATGTMTGEFIRGDSSFAALHRDQRFQQVLTAADRSSAPCAADPNARRFDFWIGEWEVRSIAGQVVGSSSVQSVSGQCALLENWTSRLGTTGKSLNAYNPALKQWQQYWVGQGGQVTEYRESTWAGRSIVFLARSADSAATLNRLTFTPLAADVVRQFGEQSTDAGKTWTASYDFRYYRKR